MVSHGGATGPVWCGIPFPSKWHQYDPVRCIGAPPWPYFVFCLWYGANYFWSQLFNIALATSTTCFTCATSATAAWGCERGGRGAGVGVSIRFQNCCGTFWNFKIGTSFPGIVLLKLWNCDILPLSFSKHIWNFEMLITISKKWWINCWIPKCPIEVTQFWIS